MRISAAILVVTLMTLSSLAQEAERVTFKRRDFPAGLAVTRASTMNLDMNIKIAAGDQVMQDSKQEQRESRKLDISILEVGAVGPTKIKVDFRELKTSAMMGDEEMGEDSPVSGKTFHIALVDGSHVVTDAEGGAVADETATQVLKEMKFAGKNDMKFSDEFSKLLPETPISVGQTLTPDRSLIKDVLEFPGTVEIESFTLTMTGTKRVFGSRCAAFDVALKLVEPSGPFGSKMVFALTGAMTLGIDTTWLHDMKLQGPIAIDGGQPPEGISLDMSGAIAFNGLALYKLPSK